VVAPFTPRLDSVHGGRAAAQLLVRLGERHRLAIVHVTTPGSEGIDPSLAGLCELAEEVEIDHGRIVGSPWRHRLNVVAAVPTGRPSSVARVYDRRFARTCVQIARDWAPDIVHVEGDVLGYCGPALREAGCAAVRVLDCYEPGVVASRDQATVTGGRQRLAHRLDAIAWQRYWARTLSAFDAVVTLTDDDRGAIEAAVKGPRVVKIGIGTEIPREPLSPIGGAEGAVVYVGGLRHPPNTDAALRLVRSIMPAVRTLLPRTRLAIVGANPTAELREAAGPDDLVTGLVPSVTPYLDEAAVVALPIRIGGGMRLKLLESLAAGKAVIASRLAAAGLDITDGRELLFAESDAEFADAIVALIRDPETRVRLGRAAREWAAQNLDWDVRAEAYDELYRALLASGSR
jgi:glycosyltransferase involved in cell wall biosynthesis